MVAAVATGMVSLLLKIVDMSSSGATAGLPSCSTAQPI